MYLKRYYDNEVWKEIELKEPFNNRFQLFISNYGQIKKYNKISNTETILSQPKTEGYPSFNASYLQPISTEEQLYFAEIRKNLDFLKKEIKTLAFDLSKCDGRNATYYEILNKIEKNQALYTTINNNYTTNYKKRERKRRLFFGGLTHRFVASYFIEKPSEEHKFVAHLDYDKTNNHHSNLRWMTQKENTLHQQKSPFVIKAKAEAIIIPRITRQKLTVHQVMVIKKQINEGVTLRKLAKRYKVSETQLLRIKRGINWANIPAAK